MSASPPVRPGALRLALVVVVVATSSCFSMQRADFHVEWSYSTARVTISRHNTRDLLGLYKVTEGSTRTKEKAVANKLRAEAKAKIECPGPCTSFVRNRWDGATASAQYSDLGGALRATDVRWPSKCIVVKIKVGAGNVGYDWYTKDIKTPEHPYWYETHCFWGVDREPRYP